MNENQEVGTKINIITPWRTPWRRQKLIIQKLIIRRVKFILLGGEEIFLESLERKWWEARKRLGMLEEKRMR